MWRDTAWLSFLMLSMAVPGSSAHGILTIPPARNWLAYLNDKHDWADGLSAGGYKVVGQGGGVKWPNGNHGLCGDPAGGPQPFMKPGPVGATFKAGQVIDVHFLLSTNHYGRIEFRLCPISATASSQCTKLQRADGRGDAWDLPAIAQGSRFFGGAVTIADLKPTEADSSYSWYPQPHIDCKWWKGCNRYDGFPVYRLQYKLPAGHTCDRCILQWYYLSGHKCHPPCLQTDKYFPDCRNNPKFKGTYAATMDYCGTQWSAYPEEFWNCADISIK